MSKTRTKRVLLIAGLVVLLAACAAGPNTVANTGSDVAGFWLGLWHGLISPITFLISLFDDDVNIYEVHNNGNWYDFGFVLGIAAAFSGAARSGDTTRYGRSAKTGR